MVRRVGLLQETVEEGPKAVIRRLLIDSGRPMTSDELWEKAEKEGIKSKRFMKMMLSQMRSRGAVKTSPKVEAGSKSDNFVYKLVSE